MKHQLRAGARVAWLPYVTFSTLSLAMACQGSIGNPTKPDGKPQATETCTPADLSTCAGSEVQVSKRIVRLTFNQVVASLRSLLGNTLGDQIAGNDAYALVDSVHRTFPPLSNPRETASIGDTNWDKGDRMAQQAAQYLFDNFATITGCSGATLTDSCAQTFARTFAARAYRRPLTSDETGDLDKVYTDVKALGSSVQESTQFAVYAVLDSPSFLYRTELGAGASADGPLSPYELASQLSFFLTDAPPDPPLLEAAAGGMLATEAQLRAQADRILATDAARKNLHDAMMSYFAIPTLETIVIDSGTNPAWNNVLRSSMYHESDLFLGDVLANGKLADLITTRKSRINQALAPIYGVSWPPAGVTLDADGFGLVDLPDSRAGMLTQGGFLVARARPQAGSVVGRGLLVNAAMLCNVNPAFPTELAGEIAKATAMLGTATEKEKAAYRADKSRPCSGCHPNFDPFGLALENFDTIAQYRTSDSLGRPIDAAVTLPPSAGCTKVNGAVEMAAAFARENTFTNCVVKNVMSYALAQTTIGVSTNSCANRAVVDRFNAAGEKTFTSLIREIAVSQTLTVRNAGVGP